MQEFLANPAIRGNVHETPSDLDPVETQGDTQVGRGARREVRDLGDDGDSLCARLGRRFRAYVHHRAVFPGGAGTHAHG